MAASLSLVVSFTSKSGNRYQNESRPHARISDFGRTNLPCPLWMSKHQRPRKIFRPSVSDGDRLAIDATDEGPSPPVESVGGCTQSNGTVPKLEAEAESAQPPTPKSPQSSPKRSPLTARERLRAARVLSRYSESKPSEMGSKVLEALKESDGGKRRSGLPEAPTNLFDDSKRGLPKEGFTFQFPGGFDLFIVAFSFVFISTLMFATTYLVWKVGAIHFNEY